MDTIYALASAPGKAGVAVLRLSGPGAFAAATRLVGSLPEHGRSLRKVRDAQGEILDEALILTFAAGHSFTGEPTVEFQLHGSRAVGDAVMAALARIDGMRPAEAGEFTRRAFENGRLDLSQVEGLADLIEAETEGQRRQAQRVLSGALAQRTAVWRQRLIRARALIEATIDFVDEDVPVDVVPEVMDLLSVTLTELIGEAAGARIAERVRDGFEVAIVGAPNVGKSTLLNFLAGRQAALTSAVPGTTRDVIEVHLELEGLPVTLLDTAGLRETADPVEGLGIALARARADAADLRIHLVQPGSRPEVRVQPGDLEVSSQSDRWGTSGGLAVSGTTGAGVPELIAAIAAVLKDRTAGVGVAVRERHRLAIVKAIQVLEEVIDVLTRQPVRPEIVAEGIAMAVTALDTLVGRIDVEDILGEIFARFCIGK